MNVDDQNLTSAADTAASVELNEDQALGAIWDQANRDNGSTRDEDGRFASPVSSKEEGGEPRPETGEDADSSVDSRPLQTPAKNEEGTEGDDGPGDKGSEAPAAQGHEGGDQQAVPMPPNWNGMGEDWKKIPPDVQAKIAARDTELHTRMSDQGRQIGAARPLLDIVERHADLYQRHRMPDGSAVQPAQAVDFLMNAQRALDADPIRALIQIADRYDVRPLLAAVLTGQAPLPPAQQPQQPAGMSPAQVQAMVQEALQGDQQSRAIEAELGRLSKDKPLFAEIPEPDMVHAIQKAKTRLGETASREAVFNLAYDMAVNADPDLRAKVARAAAAAVTKTAAEKPARSTADQRRASSINVKSTSTGRSRDLTEDELLAQAFDMAHEKG